MVSIGTSKAPIVVGCFRLVTILGLGLGAGEDVKLLDRNAAKLQNATSFPRWLVRNQLRDCALL